MKNAVGREIPDYLLTEGREVYQGKNYMDGKYIQKASPRTRRYEKPQESKLVDSLAQALRQCGARSGMTFSFHHHLRDGDYVVNLVMAAAIEELGLKDLTIAATSLGSAHDPIADYIEQGKVVGIQTSGIRGRMGEVVSAGKLKTPAVIRSHGGRSGPASKPHHQCDAGAGRRHGHRHQPGQAFLETACRKRQSRSECHVPGAPEPVIHRFRPPYGGLPKMGG